MILYKDFTYIYLVKSATNPRNAPPNFCHYLKELLHDEFVTHFTNQIQQNKENSKLRLFRKVKVNFNFEYYLSELQNVKHRRDIKILTMIEFVNIVNWNEQHYLMSCSNTMFRTLRNKFIHNLYKINKSSMLFNTQDLFHYVLAMKDNSILKILSKYFFDILAAFDVLE